MLLSALSCCEVPVPSPMLEFHPCKAFFQPIPLSQSLERNLLIIIGDQG